MEVALHMSALAQMFGRAGIILRSGAADGADTAFETGCDLVNGPKEIYLPWQGFNNSKSNIFGPYPKRAAEIAKDLHPEWGKCDSDARKLHTRNVPQVLGRDLNQPSLAMFCWTPHGMYLGGTAMAMRVAGVYNVPLYNFGSMRVDYIFSQAKRIIATAVDSESSLF